MERTLTEEISKIQQLSEVQGNSGNDLGFSTPNVQVSVQGLESILNISRDNLDYEVRRGATVEWKLTPVKSSGELAYFLKKIESIGCLIEWREFDTDKNGTINFDTKSPEYKEWEIKEELTFDSNGGITLGFVEIDFTRSVVIVSN